MAKVSFTLPISCQICLGKVKEPVLCPNQHVFCMRCMDAWLECNQRCPTCRIDITPQSPIRKIIGSQDDCKHSPKISRQIRKIRMQKLINEYEDDVQNLQSEVESLHSTNQELKTQLNSAPGGSKCARCYSIDDLDDMLMKTKRLQAMSETFDEMKVDCKTLRERNEELIKANDDLKRQNEKIKLEIQTRSPMKFGRLTVLTLESRLSDYEKQVTQLKKALECNDKHNESLQKQLQACVCGAGNFDVTQRSLLDKIEISNFMKSGKEKVSRKLDLQPPDPEKGQEVIGYVEGSDIYLSPFTPSDKFSQMHIQTPGSDQNMILRQMLESKDSNSQDSGISTGHSSQDDLCDHPEPKVVRSFSAQEMPAVESPDYKQKLEQIQDNLLHPITHAESSVHQTKTFSRRLTFEDGNAANEDGRQVDLSAFLNLDETSNVSEVMLLPSEDSRMSVGDGQGSEPVFGSYIESSTPQDVPESHFAMPERPATLYMSQPPTELTEASSNPVLTSLIRSESCKATLHSDPVNIVSDDGKSVMMDVCGARITTTKLSQQERDLFARPSSAPSRTFLLSGSRFSALRPLDPTTTDSRDNSGFQPVKCKSPSPLTMRKQFTKPVRPVSSPLRGTPDKRAPSPLLRLVSPDDVINTKWKQTSTTITPVPSRALPVSSHMSPVQPQMAPTCSHSGFSSHGSHASSVFAPVSPHCPRQPTPIKGTSSRVAILKRRSSGKFSQMANTELKSNEETASVSARKNSRKQRLVMRDDLRTKRSGDHSLNFISPLKSPKYDGH